MARTKVEDYLRAEEATMGRPVTLVSAFTTHLPEQQIEITQLVYSVEYEGLEELGKVVRLALYVNGRPYWSSGGLKNG